MITYLTRLTSERDSLTQAATELTEKAAGDERDLTDTEASSMRAWAERCAQIDAQLTEYGAQAESQRAYARLRGDLERPADETPQRAPAGAGLELEARAWGDAFTTSEAFLEYRGAGTSPRVTVPFELEQRAPIMVTGAGGLFAGMPPYTYNPAAYVYPSPLLEVVGKVTTNTGAIQWVQWAPNPQAAATLVPEGDPKPEAVMTPVITTDSLETYAHWKGVTRQALEDVPQIRTTVENRLRTGLVVALEGAIAAALAAAPIPPVTGSGAGGDTLLSTIRVAVATVQAAGYGAPNAVLLNPADWAELDVAIMAGTLGGPSSQAGFWGMRPIAVPQVPAGTAYVGNFETAVQLFTRGSAELYLTDSHADNFIRNVVLLLAEIRALATVPDPAAAAKCTVGVATTGAGAGR